MFSDESRFSVISDSGHQLLWIERYVQKSVYESDRYGVMAGIMHNSRLDIFDVEELEILQSKNVLYMQQSAYSPDLNSVEHACNALGRRVVPLRTAQHRLERGVRKYLPKDSSRVE
ncbi:hypothetical protein TNCV_4264981 [Trichonephila clavipes]|nr:hypothetical protein TNCV_4264981 [Trichonephila clavipes]